MHSGAEWVKRSFKVEMSPLGEAVANLLGRVWRGVYHLKGAALRRVNWENPYCVRYVHDGDLSTIDFSNLTALVVFAHDEMIRISMRGIGPGYTEMLFHQRESRTGSIMERCPTIEDHIKELRQLEKAA